jgi:hypothetical protein
VKIGEIVLRRKKMEVTYRILKDALNKLTDAQLDQQAQIMLPQADGDKPIPLHEVIGFETVLYFCTPPGSKDESQCDKTRSCVDNEHHPEQLVFLCDYNLYDEDGTIGFDLFTGERIYGKDGKKDVEVENEFNDTFPGQAGLE